MFDFVARRKRLLEALPDRSLVWLQAGSQVLRNGDATYPFRQQSDFLYLTGWIHPHGMFGLYKDGHTIESVWGSDPISEQKALWEGGFLGPRSAALSMGFAEGMKTAGFETWLIDAQKRAEHVYVLPDVASDILDNEKMRSVAPLLAKLRLLKDETEIATMDLAAKISLQAHQAMAEACHVGMTERALYGVFLASIYAQGAQAEAYSAIVAAGANACVLHYHALDGVCQDGDLLLVDAGAELHGYASDISRTYPVSGKWRAEQKAVHDGVLHVQQTLIAQLRSGQSWQWLKDQSNRLITEVLIDLGILKGGVEQLIQEEAFKPYFPHGVGHWLGLDVHDVGTYKTDDDQPVVLQEGMVLTCEPGLYFPAGDEQVPKAFRGMGVRIEDDVLIEQTGSRVLGAQSA